MNLQMVKKYWYVLPIIGLLVWVGIYFYMRVQVNKKMESVRQAKADKSASDFLGKDAEEVKMTEEENMVK